MKKGKRIKNMNTICENCRHYVGFPGQDGECLNDLGDYCDLIVNKIHSCNCFDFAVD